MKTSQTGAAKTAGFSQTFKPSATATVLGGMLWFGLLLLLAFFFLLLGVALGRRRRAHVAA